jgi:myo-inositol-1(or 4)-monophosphatase
MSSENRLYTCSRLRAQAVAVSAGAMLRAAHHRRRTVDFKGEIDLVTEMDRKVERYIGRELSRSFPTHDFLAEEAQRNVATGSEFRWVVDPLDGTTNYAHGLPIYSVSIALEHGGQVVVGVVYQPALDELFAAQKGWGARLNGRRIAVSARARLAHCLLVTGFPYDMHTTRDDNLKYFRRFSKRARAVRRLGSAALDLCYVACGRFDGYWEMKLAPWDVAAGSLIAAEAGARITTMQGRPFSIYGRSIVAAGSRLHGILLRHLRG